MHSRDKLVKMFRTMGLDSPQERERFKKMRRLHTESKSVQSRLFINVSGGTSTSQSEVEDAELETDSR
jgi:hypothetical protein